MSTTGASKEKVVLVNTLLKETSWESGAAAFLDAIKKSAKERGIPTKDLLTTMRFLLTGRTKGLGVADLFALLSVDTLTRRLQQNI